MEMLCEPPDYLTMTNQTTVTTVIVATVTSRIGMFVATGCMQSRHILGRRFLLANFCRNSRKKAQKILVYSNKISIV